MTSTSMSHTAGSTGSHVGQSGPELPDAVIMAEKFFATPFDPEAQADMCSDRMEAHHLHSWPMKKLETKDEFLKHQRAIQRGCPDFDYRACVWRTANFDPYETDEQGNMVVHATVHARCRHTDDLEVEGHLFGGTEEDIIFPKEWVTTHWTNTDPPTLDKLVSRQILDVEGCSTGGLCGVPGFMFAMGKPLPPPLTEILAPIPPATAADNRDPNFKMRVQVFKQIVRRDDAKKAALKDLIGMQQREIQQHMDYLNSIRNYL